MLTATPGLLSLPKLVTPDCGARRRPMQRPDLLIAFLAFGAAVCTLLAWLWASMAQPQRR